MLYATLLVLADAKGSLVRKHHHQAHHAHEHTHFAFLNASLCSMNPGDGMTQTPADGSGPDGTVAGAAINANILKDGYWYVDCKTDAMFSQGDKFGDGAQRFEEGLTHGTSIVRYDVIHDRETQKPMTPQVCFDFCRTVPEMQYFGLTEGRACYCMHFYVQKAGDGVCDLPCEGDSATTCGGKDKSSLYQMHECEGGFSSKVSDYQNGIWKDAQQLRSARYYADYAAEDLQDAGDYLESVGDGTASALAQAAKAAVSPIAKLYARLDKDYQTMQSSFSELSGFNPHSSSLSAADRKASEANMKKNIAHMKKVMAALPDDQAAIRAVLPWTDASMQRDALNYEDFEDYEASNDAWDAYQEEQDDHADDTLRAAATYEHIVGRDDETTGAVCGGELTGEPKVYASAADCAFFCDNHAPRGSDDHCVGFQYFNDYDGLCFLFKKVTELTTYDCSKKKKKLFLQSKKKHTEDPEYPEVLERDDDLPWCMLRHQDFGPAERKVVGKATPVGNCFGD